MDEYFDDFDCLEMYELYNICEDCEVKDYCRDIDKEYEDRCIYNDVDDCFYYYDGQIDDIVEYSDEEQQRRSKEYSKIIKKRAIEFKKKRNYKKVY